MIANSIVIACSFKNSSSRTNAFNSSQESHKLYVTLFSNTKKIKTLFDLQESDCVEFMQDFKYLNPLYYRVMYEVEKKIITNEGSTSLMSKYLLKISLTLV